MTTASLSAKAPSEVRFELRGGNEALWDARDREIVVEGPRGTGKTRTILELIHALCNTFPGLSVLIVRKYQRTLATTCLRTFNEQVLRPGDPIYFGGNEQEPAAYRYRNGSRVIVGGMDNPEKVKSSEYDLVYCNEVTELTLDDYEALLPLLRHAVHGRRLIEAQRIIADCNPAASTHWIKQRWESGGARHIHSVLKDNPFYYESDGTPTEAGQAYIDTLRGLTGTRYERWVLGIWTGMEDAIYPAFDRNLHVRPLESGLRLETVLGVDYGRAHLSAVVALSRDQYGRRWVREAWAEVDQDGGKSIMRTIGAMRQQYSVARGRVDPNQGFLGGQAGFNIAKGSAGSRMHRIDLMEPLFYSYPGGRVPTLGQEFNQALPHGPYAEPDSPGILFVEGAPGIEELCSEIEAYHYVWTETPKGKTKDVYRVDENRIAALEYAAEELSEGADYTSLLTARAALLRR